MCLNTPNRDVCYHHMHHHVNVTDMEKLHRYSTFLVHYDQAYCPLLTLLFKIE